MTTKYNPEGKIYVGIPRERVYIPMFVDNRDVIMKVIHDAGRGSGYYQAEGHRVDRNRDKIVEAFLESDGEWLLFLDSDMDHPPSIGLRLTRFGKPIVAGLYFARGSTHDPFVFKDAPDGIDDYGRQSARWKPMRDDVFKFLDSHSLPMRDGHIIVEPTKYDPLYECDAVATGTLMIHREVLESEPGPWFEYESGGNSEDLVWCRRQKQRGYPIYCDLSTISGHYNWVAMGQAQFRTLYLGRGVTLSGYGKDDAMKWLTEFGKLTEEQADELTDQKFGHPTGDLWRERFGDRVPSDEEVKEFYEDPITGQIYLMELLSWNQTIGFENLKKSLIRIREFDQNGFECLDLGAGIGTIGIQMVIQRNNVICVEPNQFLRDFIQHRYEEMQREITTVTGEMQIWDSWIGKLPDNSLRLITCFDVFEHMTEDVLLENLRECYRTLGDSGRLIYHNNFHQQDIFPNHFDHSEKWNGWLEEIGFKSLNAMEAVKIIT